MNIDIVDCHSDSSTPESEKTNKTPSKYNEKKHKNPKFPEVSRLNHS